jgi:hypothetical protein
MPRTIDDVVDHIRNHRCFRHPVFDHWAQQRPAPEVVGALFHQIQCFCAATRPGGSFPWALRVHGLVEQSRLLQEIVDSEADHGPELATMAGFIVNRAAARAVCADLGDQAAVEAHLRACSDLLLWSLPGYDGRTGLAVQTRRAIDVFARRACTDRDSTIRNLGTALALELVSNGHLIPGEKDCLVDSGIYGARLDDPEMHYLREHWGDIGAEQQHEKNAIAAVAAVLDAETEPLVMQGADDFLDSLAGMWDLLDAALLASGFAADDPAGAVRLPSCLP